MKQGDLLSPILFIISVKVLSRSLNNLFLDRKFIEFGMAKWNPQINHLACVDDTILFGSRDKYSIFKMMSVISKYETTLGQRMNKDKSFFYVYEKSPLIVTLRLRKLTGLKIGNFPLIYLGRPIFLGRRKICHFEDMLNKISKRIRGWANRFLSFGGRQILINDVLSYIPIYLLSMMNPLKKVLDQITEFLPSSSGVTILVVKVNIRSNGRIFVSLFLKVG